MDLDTTIVAISSPLGSSSKAIIRATGKKLFEELEPFGFKVLPRKLHVEKIHVGKQLLPVLVGFFSKDRSYTGQETVEIQLPNNSYLINTVMESILLTTRGRFATAGEFTARAFFHGRMSLTQAEGVCATIAADNDAELQGAALLRQGALANHINPIATELTQSLALVEAGIDFTDEEDVVAIASPELEASIDLCTRSLRSILDGKISMATLRTLPLVVIAGLPNAGKSTLFNALLGKRRVVVSDLAGTTRDAIAEPTKFGNKEALLVDIAGLELPTDAVQTAAQHQAQYSMDQADVVLYCVAPDDSAAKGDHRMLIVHTKGDLEHAHPDAICAMQQVGMSELKKRVESQLRTMPSPHSESLALLPRHEQHLKEAITCLKTAKQDVQTRELVANSLRAALNEIGCITGQVTPDEVLGQVFSSFCVGK